MQKEGLTHVDRCIAVDNYFADPQSSGFFLILPTREKLPFASAKSQFRLLYFDLGIFCNVSLLVLFICFVAV